VLYNHAVPELASPPFDSAEHDLDAFVLDFYRHGNLETLIRESSIERGDVWFRLQDFDRALGGIHSAFKALYNRKGDNVADDEMDDARDAKEDRRDAGGDADKEHVLVRPPGISNDDWALYRVIDTLYNEFHTAFYAIFA